MSRHATRYTGPHLAVAAVASVEPLLRVLVNEVVHALDVAPQSQVELHVQLLVLLVEVADGGVLVLNLRDACSGQPRQL